MIFLSRVEKNEKFVCVVSTCCLMLIASSQNQVQLEMISVCKSSIRYVLCLGKAVFSDVKLKNIKQPLLDVVLTNLLATALKAECSQ